jgi:hypothetical protein
VVALQVLVDSGDFKGADHALSRLNKVSGDCTHARLLAAKMYLKEGNYEKVSWETGRLLKNEPNNVQALLTRGESFFYLEVRTSPSQCLSCTLICSIIAPTLNPYKSSVVGLNVAVNTAPRPTTDLRSNAEDFAGEACIQGSRVLLLLALLVCTCLAYCFQNSGGKEKVATMIKWSLVCRSLKWPNAILER